MAEDAAAGESDNAAHRQVRCSGKRQLTVNDANDVIDELTINGGRQMWTRRRWDNFVPRLKRWMMVWEKTRRRNGLTLDGGFLLGGEAPGVADIVITILWSTMTVRFASIGAMFEQTSPMTAALARRVSAVPSLADLAGKARRDHGDVYCDGRIETSLRKVLET